MGKGYSSLKMYSSSVRKYQKGLDLQINGESKHNRYLIDVKLSMAKAADLIETKEDKQKIIDEYDFSLDIIRKIKGP